MKFTTWPFSPLRWHSGGASWAVLEVTGWLAFLFWILGDREECLIKNTRPNCWDVSVFLFDTSLWQFEVMANVNALIFSTSPHVRRLDCVYFLKSCAHGIFYNSDKAIEVGMVICFSPSEGHLILKPSSDLEACIGGMLSHISQRRLWWSATLEAKWVNCSIV